MSRPNKSGRVVDLSGYEHKPIAKEVAGFIVRRLGEEDKSRSEVSLDTYYSSFRCGDKFYDMLPASDLSGPPVAYTNVACNLRVPSAMAALGFDQELFDELRGGTDDIWEFANTEKIRFNNEVAKGNPGQSWVDFLLAKIDGDNLPPVAQIACAPFAILAFVLAIVFGLLLDVFTGQMFLGEAKTEKHVAACLAEKPDLEPAIRKKVIGQKFVELAQKVQASAKFQQQCVSRGARLEYTEDASQYYH